MCVADETVAAAIHEVDKVSDADAARLAQNDLQTKHAEVAELQVGDRIVRDEWDEHRIWRVEVGPEGAVARVHPDDVQRCVGVLQSDGQEVCPTAPKPSSRASLVLDVRVRRARPPSPLYENWASTRCRSSCGEAQIES